jgi:hypothetical protein
MDGLWGMGEMMFTKYIVAVDDDVGLLHCRALFSVGFVHDGAGLNGHSLNRSTNINPANTG